MLDVVVVGAGLAGLSAAGVLSLAGKNFEIWDSADQAGGRIRTNRHERGFLLDEGFALLNPAYPAAKRIFDYQALDLHAWEQGTVAAHTGSDGRLRSLTLATPLGHAGALKQAMKVLGPKDALALAKLVAKPPQTKTLGQALAEAGLNPALEQIVRRFLSGVVADPDLGCTATFGASLLRFFALGKPSLPAQGMGALVAQLTAKLAQPVKSRRRVEALRLHPEGVELDFVDVNEHGQAGETQTVSAKQVILAAGPKASANLLGLEAPQMGSLRTWWFATPTLPTDSRMLHLDCDDDSPINHTAVVSNVCPSYAPAGWHLVEVTAVGAEPTDRFLAAEEVAARAASMMGAEADDWELLTYQNIANALPRVTGSELAVDSPHLVLAGDTAHASINGALESGERAAARVLERL
ncbi:hypothetical protein BK816_01260 [Boudabousia tangfeifanii]|uniref:Amine oxidase domain-containing protein n=1 Tax=Boudabousia tangfeifanii TaxID=1912795 RepID=A0A1D9MID5_9ACTO|nr:FAD-dependent oxidoreductase [Boudabousia tangfeifanii]AOZ72091.1 hypothetical protein BK816_01260 [Boudabousia tangfeifanii]